MKKKRERIYIIPNWFGLMYGAGIMASLITASTYSNNLVYALSFFMVGLFLIGMVQANSNVKSSEIERIQFHLTEELKAGRASVWIRNNSRSDKFLIQLSIPFFGKQFASMIDDVPAKALIRHDFEFPAQQAGHFRVDKVKLSSVFPLGTFFSWKTFKVDAIGYTYPRPQGDQELPESFLAGDSQALFMGRGGDDFSEHRTYQKGESVQHVDWKAFARGRGLLTKKFDEGDVTELHFKIVGDIEKLRQVSKWIEFCEQQAFAYRLSKNETELLGTGLGRLHKGKALLLLAKEVAHDL